MSPEEIAAGLTKGQRTVLRTVTPCADGRILVPSMLGNLNASVGWPKGMIAYYSPYYSRLTLLGIQVRTILEGNTK